MQKNYNSIIEVCKILNKETFQLSKDYIIQNGRPIDKLRFLFEFDNQEAKNIFQELEKYQNEDGGFGNSLEPDIRIKNSSVICTTVAFQYLNNTKVNLPEKLIEKAIIYLISNIQKYGNPSKIKYFWKPLPANINQEIIAPWWINTGIKESDITSWPNPSVEIIGYLVQHSKYVPGKLIQELLEDLETYLDMVSKLPEPVSYNFLCFKRAITLLPESIQKRILKLFNNTFSKAEVLNQENLHEIKIQMLVTETNSFLNQKFSKEVKKAIEIEIKDLNVDGGSHPSWKWGSDEEWKIIEKEWTGKLTVELLETLKYNNLLNF